MQTHENYLHQMLESLRTRLLTMGAKASQALEDSCYALVRRDVDKANAVLSADDVIDNMENEIDEAALNILACTQPVARDLRFVISALRMVLDLERIGDESVLVAKQALALRNRTPSILIGDLDNYGQRAVLLLRKSLDSFQNNSVDLAEEVFNSDTVHADMTQEIIEKIIDNLNRKNIDGEICVYALMVVRALDRVCRRAQNIAEHTYFMVQGVSIKHKFKRNEE